MKSIVDITIYKENTLEVSLGTLKMMSNTTVVYEFLERESRRLLLLGIGKNGPNVTFHVFSFFLLLHELQNYSKQLLCRKY